MLSNKQQGQANNFRVMRFISLHTLLFEVGALMTPVSLGGFGGPAEAYSGIPG